MSQNQRNKQTEREMKERGWREGVAKEGERWGERVLKRGGGVKEERDRKTKERVKDHEVQIEKGKQKDIQRKKARKQIDRHRNNC